MKLYKYRDLSDLKVGLPRVGSLLQTRAFWCARPDTLNDPEEFAWTGDYRPSPRTADLLTELIVQLKGRSRALARNRVVRAINAGRLRELAEPAMLAIIQPCRNEIGLACFGSSAENDVLWKRYAGSGAGVCIEVDVRDRLLGTQFHYVHYWDKKVIHIDTLLRSRFDSNSKADFYALSLLSKPSSWSPEAEIRFISKRQNVGVVIEESSISALIIGDTITPDVREMIGRMAPAVPLKSRGAKVLA